MTVHEFSLVSRLNGRLGMFLALVGHRLKGGDVYHAGVATHLCPSDQIPSLKQDLLNSGAESKEQIEAILDGYTSKFPIQPFSLEPELAFIDKARRRITL